MHVVICGGGVIGACTAWFLARRGVEVTVVERNEVAGAASGKAGGFVTADWCAGSSLDRLARRSFTLHSELADTIEDDWGYQRTTTYGGFVARNREAGRRAPAALDWVCDGVAVTHRLGTPDTTAMVNPRKFTVGMMRAAQKLGAKVCLGQVTGVLRAGSTVKGVEIDGSAVEADATVVAMGPWTVLAADWLPLPEVYGRQSPSLIYDTGKDVPAEALFLEYRDTNGDELTIEVFPRADGTTHVCAFGADAPLPRDPAQVTPDPEAIERLRGICERVSPAFTPERIVAKQACFRPFTRDFVPLIGRVPRTEGAYVATGHNVWGIANSPATGEALAELIVDGKARSVDLRPFDPGRLR